MAAIRSVVKWRGFISAFTTCKPVFLDWDFPSLWLSPPRGERIFCAGTGTRLKYGLAYNNSYWSNLPDKPGGEVR